MLIRSHFFFSRAKFMAEMKENVEIDEGEAKYGS